MAEARQSAAAQSLRELVINAGLELIENEGLSLTFDSISYAKVFEYLWEEYEVTVTRGSVHERIWASQDDFRRDVLAESVSYFSDNGIMATLFEQAESNDGPSEFARSLGSGALPEMMRRPMFGRYQSVKALSCWFDDPLATDTLHELLNERAERALAEASTAIPATFARLGLQPRSDLGLEADQAASLWVVLTTALTEGGLLNYHAGSHDLTSAVDYLFTPADADGPWSYLAVGIKSLLDALYEPNPTPDVDEPPPVIEPPARRPLRVEAPRSGPEAKPVRRQRSQLRELVLTAAVELLFRNGPELRPELLTYSSVLGHLKKAQGVTVNRSSIHPRIWTSNEDFRLDVLAACLDASSTPVRALSEVIEVLQPQRRPDGSVDPQRSASEVFRLGGSSVSGFSKRAKSFRLLLQIKASLIDLPDTRATTALRALVAKVESQRMEGNNAELRGLVLQRGFRVKPEIGISEDDAVQLFQTLSMTTAAGLIFNELAGIQAATRQFTLPEPGAPDETEEWSPLGFAMRSFFYQLFEEDVPTPD